MKLEKLATTPYVTQVELFTKLVTVIVAASFVMSVFYDYSYLSALGLSFDDVPSLTTEHIRSALLWGPVAALITLAAAGHELLEWRERDRLPESFILRRPRPPLTFSKKEALIVLVFFTPFIGIFRGNAWMYLAGAAVLTGLMIYIVRDEVLRLKISESRVFYGILFPLPMVFMFIGLYGYMLGGALILNTSPTWELTIRAGTTVKKQTVTGLRRFSTFAIVADQAKFVSIIPNDSILEAKRLEKLAVPPSNFCLWLGFRCDPPRAVTPAKPPASILKSSPAPAQPPTRIGPTALS
jgi:hypothetical protein